MARKKGKAIWHFSDNNINFVDSRLAVKGTMIHEHDFKQTNLIIPTAFCVIQCITCKKYLCDSCGKLINNYDDFRNHVCRVDWKL